MTESYTGITSMKRNIVKLKNGKVVFSLMRYPVVFDDGTTMPAADLKLLDSLTPHLEEEVVMLPNQLKTIKLVKRLKEEQKVLLDRIQLYANVVLLPRVILDALNEKQEERISRFARCVGQKLTEDSHGSQPDKSKVLTDCWMY